MPTFQDLNSMACGTASCQPMGFCNKNSETIDVDCVESFAGYTEPIKMRTEWELDVISYEFLDRLSTENLDALTTDDADMADVTSERGGMAAKPRASAKIRASHAMASQGPVVVEPPYCSQGNDDPIASIQWMDLKQKYSSDLVVLHVYDISKTRIVESFNRACDAIGCGAYHVGIEVTGREYSYGCGARGKSTVDCHKPLTVEKMHRYHGSINLGTVSFSLRERRLKIRELAKEWRRKEYHVLNNNCVHFADALASKLGVGPVPAFLNNLPTFGNFVISPFSSVFQAFTKAFDGIKCTGGGLSCSVENKVDQAPEASEVVVVFDKRERDADAVSECRDKEQRGLLPQSLLVDSVQAVHAVSGKHVSRPPCPCIGDEPPPPIAEAVKGPRLLTNKVQTPETPMDSIMVPALVHTPLDMAMPRTPVIAMKL